MALHPFFPALVAACLSLVAFPVPAQGPGGLSFEVVSIRPSAPDAQRWSYKEEPDRVTLTATASTLVANAYGKDLSNVVGGPGWIEADYYDVNASFTDATRVRLAALSRNERVNAILRMLQPVMEQRFGLKIHHELRQVPAYALLVNRTGPKFRRAPAAATQDEARLGDASYNGHLWTVRREPMSFLALQLSRVPEVGRVVVDQTGLAGEYTWNFDWSAKTHPDESVFTAITEQLGLKLEPTRTPVDFVVIDDIQRPSAN